MIKRKEYLLIFFSTLFILASCSQFTQPTPTSTPTATTQPTATTTPTKTPSPTATPIGGGQGKVIFLAGDYEERHYDINSMNLDGTGIKQLTFLEGTILHPVWSPDGEEILFMYREDEDGFWQLYTMNPDGSEITKISTHDSMNYGYPDWSFDGKKIIFSSEGTNKYNQPRIFSMDPDGSNETQITDGTRWRDYGDLSPDGSKILFKDVYNNRSQIFVINSDGTDQKRLTDFPYNTERPQWSPDGKYILFYGQIDRQFQWEILLMKSDGTDLVRLTENDTWDVRPKFSPDGTKIYWDHCCFNLWMMNLDGSEKEQINSDWGWDYQIQP
jgi:Tol biopolymer transport system component